MQHFTPTGNVFLSCRMQHMCNSTSSNKNSSSNSSTCAAATPTAATAEALGHLGVAVQPARTLRPHVLASSGSGAPECELPTMQCRASSSQTACEQHGVRPSVTDIMCAYVTASRGAAAGDEGWGSMGGGADAGAVDAPHVATVVGGAQHAATPATAFVIAA